MLRIPVFDQLMETLISKESPWPRISIMNKDTLKKINKGPRKLEFFPLSLWHPSISVAYTNVQITTRL